jgi:hypothetical protein
VRVAASAGQVRAPRPSNLGRSITLTKPCYVLEALADFTELKEFTGFTAPSSDTVLRIVRSMDRFYSGKYKGGIWKLQRADTLESGMYRAFYALPGDDQYRFVWRANLRTGEFVPMTRCAEEVEQFMHEH